MQNYILYPALVITVISTVSYHFIQKSTPTNVNPLMSLFVTYLIAAGLCVISYPLFYKGRLVASEFQHLNWTSVALGIAIFGIELGFLFAYRLGGNLSTTNLLSSSLVVLLLFPIGIIVFKDHVTLSKLIGALFCLVGITMLTK